MYLFIINNQSGKGAYVWKKTLPLLTKMDVEFKSYFIKKPEDLVNIKLELDSLHVKALVIVGGDGTIHHALKLVENTSIPLGIIPAGSGNDFARALNIPKNHREALTKIIAGKTKKIDLIKMNDLACATVVGVGFDAKVADLTNKSKVKQWLNIIKFGKFAYVLGVLRSVFSYTPTNIVLNVDGKETSLANVWLIAIANTPYYGGGLKISPDANTTDSTLNICIAHSLSKLEILMFFPLVFLGKHTVHPRVLTTQGQVIQISSQSNVLVQADGEILGNTPVSIKVAKKTLNVII